MEEWRRILAQSIVKPKDLADRLGVDEKEVEDIVGDYPIPLVWPCRALIILSPVSTEVRKWLVPLVKSA